MQFYVEKNGQSEGPLTEMQIRAGIDAGQYTPDILAWRSGLASWQRLSAVISLDLSKPPPISASSTPRRSSHEEIPLPPSLPVAQLASKNHRKNDLWIVAGRDAVVIFLLTSAASVATVFFPEDMEALATTIFVGIASIAGFTFVGLSAPVRKSQHLLRTASILWAGDVIFALFTGISILAWLTTTFVFSCAALMLGMVLSYFLKDSVQWPSKVLSALGPTNLGREGTMLPPAQAATFHDPQRETVVLRMIQICACLLYLCFGVEIATVLTQLWIETPLTGPNEGAAPVLGMILLEALSVLALHLTKRRELALWVMAITGVRAFAVSASALIGGGFWVFNVTSALASLAAFGVSMLAVKTSFTLRLMRDYGKE